mgnify:CR=1 FL=1
MPTRAIWEGTISFGLVQIPVGLHAAETRDDIDFDLLDRRDLAPVGYQRYNRNTDEVVEWDDIVKGYEYKQGEYVVLEKEDFKRANVKATQTVDIVHFTDASAIDPMMFERPYYLVPGKRGQKAYVLLREVLRKADKVGVARVVIRTREYVAALLVRGPALVLELLRYDHELRKPADFDLPAQGSKQMHIAPAELKMAERLVAEGADKPFLDVLMPDASTLVVVGAYGLAFASLDSGRHWASWLDRFDNPKALHLYALHQHGDSWLAVGEQGLMLRSNDGGKTFRRLQSPYKGSFFVAELIGEQDIVVAGLRGNVWRSVDAGSSWTQVAAPMPASITASLRTPDGELLLANQAGFVMKLAGDRLEPMHKNALPPINGLVLGEGRRLTALTVMGAMPLPVTAAAG